MHQVRIQKHQFPLPENWQELTATQYRQIAGFLHLEHGPEVRLSALMAMVPGKSKAWIQKLGQAVAKKPDDRFSAEGEGLRQMTELIAWLWIPRGLDEDGEVRPEISSFKVGKEEFWLPEKSLNDVVLDEWAFTEHYLEQLYEEPENGLDHLTSLVAVLCRPPRPERERKAADFDGYPRIRFNPEWIEKRKKALWGKLDDHILRTVHSYVLRSQLMLKDRYEILFDGPKSEEPGFGWEGIKMGLAESQAFGPLEAVRFLNIHDVCLYLAMKKTEAQRQQKEAEAQRRRLGLKN